MFLVSVFEIYIKKKKCAHGAYDTAAGLPYWSIPGSEKASKLGIELCCIGLITPCRVYEIRPVLWIGNALKKKKKSLSRAYFCTFQLDPLQVHVSEMCTCRKFGEEGNKHSHNLCYFKGLTMHISITKKMSVIRDFDLNSNGTSW